MSRLAAIALLTLPTAYAQSPADGVVRILSENCVACHGSARMSGLDLRTREGMLSGGKRGPAIVPGKASESLLYKAITHEGDLRMPPGKQSLDPDKVKFDPRVDRQPALKLPSSDPQQANRAWWSFKKPARPNARSIDDLIQPEAPEADRRTLIRRATST